MIDKSLAALPRRKTDNAIIVRAQDNGSDRARVFKLNAKAGDAVLLERYVHTLLSHIYRGHISTGKAATKGSSVSIVHDAHYLSRTNPPHPLSRVGLLYTFVQGH